MRIVAIPITPIIEAECDCRAISMTLLHSRTERASNELRLDEHQGQRGLLAVTFAA